MKTIGVLGGLGPQATIEFEKWVLRFAQRWIPRRANSGYPPMAVLHYRNPLILLDDLGVPVFPLRPDPLVLEAAATLGGLSDFLVVVSNGAHRFAHELARAAGKPLLNMVDLAVAEVEARGWRSVGILTYVDPGIYSTPLGERSLGCEIVQSDLQLRLDAGILAVMEGREDAASQGAAHEAVSELRRRGVDGILLGCTEIPFLLGEAALASDLLDPLPILAEAAVKRSAGLE